MSHSEGKAEVQVPRPGVAFPFVSIAATPPHPHISQWCRFSIPERLPLKPFRQDRLTRLPLPPAVMATSKVSSTAGAGNLTTLSVPTEKYDGDVDPFQKIQQLEKNLAFVRENHAFMLKGLHEEIAELKQKNRELLFEIITGMPPVPKDVTDEPEDRGVSIVDKYVLQKLHYELCTAFLHYEVSKGSTLVKTIEGTYSFFAIKRKLTMQIKPNLAKISSDMTYGKTKKGST
ncbi:UNVERIFIED_CONTAM: hypothetical protein NCL1_36911 [Trichonephila clavipes]